MLRVATGAEDIKFSLTFSKKQVQCFVIKGTSVVNRGCLTRHRWEGKHELQKNGMDEISNFKDAILIVKSENKYQHGENHLLARRK